MATGAGSGLTRRASALTCELNKMEKFVFKCSLCYGLFIVSENGCVECPKCHKGFVKLVSSKDHQVPGFGSLLH